MASPSSNATQPLPHANSSAQLRKRQCVEEGEQRSGPKPSSDATGAPPNLTNVDDPPGQQSLSIDDIKLPVFNLRPSLPSVQCGSHIPVPFAITNAAIGSHSTNNTSALSHDSVPLARVKVISFDKKILSLEADSGKTRICYVFDGKFHVKLGDNMLRTPLFGKGNQMASELHPSTTT